MTYQTGRNLMAYSSSETNGADGAEESGYMEIWNMDPDAKPREVRPTTSRETHFGAPPGSP